MAKQPKKPANVPPPNEPPARQEPPKAKKPPRVREDLNQLAFRIVQEATGQAPKTPDPDAGKDPAAVARGKKAGAKGGPARAAKLTPEERTEIAKKAAEARWNQENQKSQVSE